MNGKRVTFIDVLRVREFRILWLADAQSAAGDQLGRVALSVLVFDRTRSAMLTAVTYALTFLPALLGGAFLSSLADRMPRRRVMVACDVLRALVFLTMALPGMPLAVVFLLLIIAVLLEAPFTAAESAMIPTILPDDYYVVGTGLRTITHQTAQLIGFAGGGLAIALLGPRRGLAVDAVTFVLSALLIMVGVQSRPATAGPEHGQSGGWSAFRGGMRFIFRDPKLRSLIGLAWLAGVYVIPEGVAAPYAAKVSHGATSLGLLMAAMPLGTALGTYLFVRWVPAEVRSTWMAPLGIGSGVPLVGCLVLPPFGISLVLWMLSGLFFSYQVQVVTEFVRAVPDSQRGQAVGIASSGLLAVQGVGVLLGGWVASAAGVGWAVGGAGLAGMALAFILGVMWSRASRGGAAAEAESSASGAGDPVPNGGPIPNELIPNGDPVAKNDPLANGNSVPGGRPARHRA